jgi:hypothetical protein
VPGLHVIDTSDVAADIQGLSIGAGYRLASWAGYRTGWPAVGVSVGHIISEVCRLRGNDIELAAVMIEQCTLHEMAHCLLGRDDMTGDQITRLIGTVRKRQHLGQTIAERQQHHHDRWAAALLILTDRAAPYRPQYADLIELLTHDQIEDSGHSVAALRRVVGPVDPEAPISHLLRADGPLTARLRAAGLHQTSGSQTDQHGAVAATRII